jgi:hypothetical protein
MPELSEVIRDYVDRVAPHVTIEDVRALTGRDDTAPAGRPKRRRVRIGLAVAGIVLAVALVALVASGSAPPNNSSKGSFHAAAQNRAGIGRRGQVSAGDITLAALTGVPQNELVPAPDPADPGWSCKIAQSTQYVLPVPLSELKAMPLSQAEAEIANVPKSKIWGLTCFWTTSTAPKTPGPLQAIKSYACNITAGSPPTTLPSNASDGLQPCSSNSGDPYAASNQSVTDQLFQSLGWGSPSWLSSQTPLSETENDRNH